MSDSLIKTPKVLVDELPLFVENLPTDIQTLWQKIMDDLPNEQILTFPNWHKQIWL